MLVYIFTLIYVKMIRKCLQCGKDFEAKRDSAKYCSDNCRVKWNYANKDKKNKLTFQVAENKLLDLIEKLETKITYSAVTPSTYDGKRVGSNYLLDEPAMFQQPKQKIRRTYDWYANSRRECQTQEDWVELRQMIEADEFLTENQKFNLTKKSVQ